jgi:hypothetical protein
VSPAAIAGVSVGAVAVTAGVLIAGWSAPGLPDTPVLALTRPAPAAAASLARPGGDMMFALDGLVGELGIEQRVAAEVVERPQAARPTPPPAPPPPPDVALVFRRAATAVVRQPGQGLAVLIARPGQASRLIRPGDLFDDRWRLSSLTMDQAVLSDGVSERRIALFAQPGAAGSPAL